MNSYKEKLNDCIESNEIPDTLPQDYQDHIDGKDETIEQKMHRLDREMRLLMAEIKKEPIF